MANKITLRVGMPEIIFIAGIYMFSQAKYIGIGLIVLGVLNAFGRYCMERSDNEAREKTTKKMIKEMCDSATAMSFAQMAPANQKLN